DRVQPPHGRRGVRPHHGAPTPSAHRAQRPAGAVLRSQDQPRTACGGYRVPHPLPVPSGGRGGSQSRRLSPAAGGPDALADGGIEGGEPRDRAPAGGEAGAWRTLPGAHRQADGGERAHPPAAPSRRGDDVQPAAGGDATGHRPGIPDESQAGRLRGALPGRIHRAGDVLPRLQALDREDPPAVPRLGVLSPGSPATLDRTRAPGNALQPMGNYQRPTIVAGLATRIIEVAARLGVDRDFMLAEGNLDPSALEERDNRVPVETFARLWHVLAARCPDRVLALDWVATWRITDAGVMGYVLQQLATLGDAMEAVGRYHTLVNQAATPRLVRGATTSRLGFVLDPVLLATQQQPEAHLVSMVG